MLCPVCKMELRLADRQGIEIDYCPTCRGVWLDRGELDKLIERSSTQNVTVATPSPPIAPISSHAAPQSSPSADKDRYRRRDDDDDDDDKDYRKSRRSYEGNESDPHPRYRRRKSFLEEIFDVFD